MQTFDELFIEFGNTPQERQAARDTVRAYASGPVEAGLFSRMLGLL